MKKMTEYDGLIEATTFGFMGTKLIPIEKILELTGGSSLDITAVSQHCTVILHLMKTPKRFEMKGGVQVKIKEYLEEE